jgi:hypothetical protein
VEGAQRQRTRRDGLEEIKSINRALYLLTLSWLLQKMLTALVQSVIRRFPNSLYPRGRIHGRTHGYKGSLLNVRKGKYKGEHGGAQVESASQEGVFLLFRCF